MKYSFVLDENVAWEAETLRDDRDRLSVDAMQLITELIKQCHRIIVCRILFEKYASLGKRLKGHRVGLDLFALLNQAATVEGKVAVVASGKQLAHEDQIPDDDRYLVRLAAEQRAILVTTDGPLRQAVAKSGVLGRRPGAKVCTPAEALLLIST